MTLVLASGNQKKVAELQTILSELLPDVDVVSMADVGFAEEIVEDGTTFEENALIKARALAAAGYIGVGDDSGLCVEALHGAPGVYSARYAGTHGDDEANMACLLQHMKGKQDRRASFRCAIACLFPDGQQPIVTQGRVDGLLLEEPRGNNGFGYDPIFFYPLFQRTLAQLDASEKNQISHRGQALRAFAKALYERRLQVEK